MLLQQSANRIVWGGFVRVDICANLLDCYSCINIWLQILNSIDAISIYYLRNPYKNFTFVANFLSSLATGIKLTLLPIKSSSKTI